MNTIEDNYRQRIVVLDEKIDKAKRWRSVLGFSRLAAFLIAVYFVYSFVAHRNLLVDSAFFLSGFALFAVLSVIDVKYSRRFRFLMQLKKINETEIECLNRNYQHLPSGEKYLDKHHPYAFDLDLFGEKSVFQVINRTTMAEGSDYLAQKLLNPLKEKTAIEERQQAIRELSFKIDFRQSFQATGISENLPEKYFPENLLSISVQKPSKLLYALAWVLPVLTILAYILYSVDVTGQLLPISLTLCQLIISGAYSLRLLKAYKKINGVSKALFSYHELLKLIEKEHFESSLLKDIQTQLLKKQDSAKAAFYDLERLIEAFDQRANVIILLFGNGLLMRDIHLLFKYDQWQMRYASKMMGWVNALAELDSLCSLANFSANNPDYIFPEIQDNTLLKAENLAHPLIDSCKRVSNNFAINRKKQFFIVTGANMAGKSTFLRTVGVNYVLACAGIPVCATSFVFTPASVFTSMRTTDNLSENTSYFHAELLRLTQLRQLLENDENTLVILDEILKGTNSKDKLTGSRLFLKKIIDFNAFGIVATHDLELGQMEQEFPDNFSNICFEITFENDDVYYDYKLKAGITEKLNATFLLHKMKLV
jgi:DNA mismatch repair ATPase MutS